MAPRPSGTPAWVRSGRLPSAPQGAFAFLARSRSTPGSVRPAAEAARSEPAGRGQGPSCRRTFPLRRRRPHSGCGSGKRCVALLFTHIPVPLGEGSSHVCGFHLTLESTPGLPSGVAEPRDRRACRTEGSATDGPADRAGFLLPSGDASLIGELDGVGQEKRTQIGL